MDRKTLVGNITEAAVLFPLIVPKTIWETGKCEGMLTDHIYILLEKRSAKMNKNPGDMAFAGGKVDNTDIDLMSTAYREAAEEIGIEKEELNFIAYMDEFVSTSKFIVRTVVSWLIIDIDENDFSRNVERRYKPLTSETENTVVVPLTHFLNPSNYSNVKYDIKSDLTNSTYGYIRYFDIHEFLHKTKIWGLTASMIRRFLDHIFPDNQLPLEEIK
ncbi:MAG: CoA pyrophosphatase [Candidatus Heimdallarchaeota archaeon]|nr:CoA pyrophosphatase [Candidatus Heimdallarchaeota archaeon]